MVKYAHRIINWQLHISTISYCLHVEMVRSLKLWLISIWWNCYDDTQGQKPLQMLAQFSFKTYSKFAQMDFPQKGILFSKCVELVPNLTHFENFFSKCIWKTSLNTSAFRSLLKIFFSAELMRIIIDLCWKWGMMWKVFLSFLSNRPYIALKQTWFLFDV